VSEPRLVSPLLDNFVMGDPISVHDGVACCPAMRCGTDDKYIVKIISVPASQTQLEALLLAGAFTSKDAALEYFRDLSDSAVQEAKTLQQLSQLDGFVGYEGWQIEPMEDGNGFDVYLLGRYRKTLARILQRNNMTHLSALNLGLDLCAALSLCRKTGFLYTDLKPNNVYVSQDSRYSIGDLGFLSLSSLKYASLPDKYRSAYTAPEIADAYSSLNTTLDIYAVGLILYQVYNGGTLPFAAETAPAEAFEPPMYADYEMAEIILKACAAAPEDRWQNPEEMGQALIGYMQRNGANDTPIIPPAVPVQPPVEETEEAPAVEEAAQVSVTEDTVPAEDVTEQNLAEETKTPAIVESDSDEERIPESEPASFAEEEPVQEENTEASNDSDAEEELLYTEDSFGNLSFLDDVSEEVAAAELEAFGAVGAVITDEVSNMLTQADELLAHPTPDPVVAPDPIEVPMPAPILPEPETEPEPSLDSTDSEESDTEEDAEEPEDAAPTEQDSVEDEIVGAPAEEHPKKKHRWVGVLITLLILLALAAGAYGYYEYYYLQNVNSLQLTGAEDYLTVTVDSEIPDAKLQVICADTYGNKFPADVIDGKAEFTELPPDRAYNVSVVIKGFHKLTGNYTATYSTPAQTKLGQLQAITGSENGSAIISFTVEGPDPEVWTLTYATDGEEPGSVSFSGHILNLVGLTPNKTYTFTLSTEEDLYVTGTTEMVFTTRNAVRAQNLRFTACDNGSLTVCWDVPAGETVESWTVHCFNDAGHSSTVTTDKNVVIFNGISTDSAYTVEVTAAEMTVSEQATLAAGSITLNYFTVEQSSFNTLNISWDSYGTVSEEGWLFTYIVDGTNSYQVNVDASNMVTISPVLPGSTYSYSVIPVSDVPFFGFNTGEYKVPAAEDFTGYGLRADVITLSMCRTPEKEDWSHKDLKTKDYTSTFAVGEKASFVARTRNEYNISEDNITTLYVIRNELGEFVQAAETNKAWIDMWWRGYCEMDMPVMPEAAGNYTVSIYFNGAFVGEQAFTVE